MNAVMADTRPLIAHVLHRFSVGGLENGLVNLVNRIPADRYRHAIISLTDASDFRDRIRRSDVAVHCIGRRPGKDLRSYGRVHALLRTLRPDVLHTRNLGTLEVGVVGRAAGVRRHVHGLHGWDMDDLHGQKRKYRWLRRACDPFVSRYVALSRDLASWLNTRIGVRREKIVQIYNGVDVTRFQPRTSADAWPGDAPAFLRAQGVTVIMWTGRMERVKNPLALLDAVDLALSSGAFEAGRVAVVMIGSGSLRAAVEERRSASPLRDRIWLAGERTDVDKLLRLGDLFVLPSLNEGISNTILEAMASAVPVVAARVGGNPELVEHGRSGLLAPAPEPADFASAISTYVRSPSMRAEHGGEARRRATEQFALDTMVGAYVRLYDELTICARTPRGVKTCVE